MIKSKCKSRVFYENLAAKLTYAISVKYIPDFEDFVPQNVKYVINNLYIGSMYFWYTELNKILILPVSLYFVNVQKSTEILKLRM